MKCCVGKNVVLADVIDGWPDGFEATREDYEKAGKRNLSFEYLQENGHRIWMVLEGSGRISMGSGIEPVAFSTGGTLLMPAAIGEEAKVVLDQDTVWLEVTFPQAQRTQIA